MRLFEHIASRVKLLAPSRRDINAAAQGVAKLISNAKALLPPKAQPPEDCSPPILQKPKISKKIAIVVETTKAPRMSNSSQPTKPRRPTAQTPPSFSEATHLATERKSVKRKIDRYVKVAMLVMGGVTLFYLGRWSYPSVPQNSANPMSVETSELLSNEAVVVSEDEQVGEKARNVESIVPLIVAQPSEVAETNQLAPPTILDESLPADTNPPKESTSVIAPSAGSMSSFLDYPGSGYIWISAYTKADGTRVEGHWSKSESPPLQRFSSPPQSSGHSKPSTSPASKSESSRYVPDSSRRPSNYGTTQPAPPKATRTWVEGHWRKTKSGRTWVDGHWRDNN